jgi:membrane fusion protein (multidrug efflux system)
LVQCDEIRVRQRVGCLEKVLPNGLPGAALEPRERQAALQRDIATLAAATGQVDVLRSQVEQSKANVAQAQAALRQAELNLSYTRIYAPSAGTVASRSVQVGNLVQPGQTLFSAVPNEVYLIANFKETR